MVSEEYQRTRERKTQDETIVFLQNRAQQLDIPLYDIRELRNSLQQDNQLATRKHREWKPAAVRDRKEGNYVTGRETRLLFVERNYVASTYFNNVTKKRDRKIEKADKKKIFILL